jgi:hypothetical protein
LCLTPKICSIYEVVAVRADRSIEAPYPTHFWLAIAESALTYELGAKVNVRYLNNSATGYEGAYQFCGETGLIYEAIVVATDVQMKYLGPNLFELSQREHRQILRELHRLDGPDSVTIDDIQRSMRGSKAAALCAIGTLPAARQAGAAAKAAKGKSKRAPKAQVSKRVAPGSVPAAKRRRRVMLSSISDEESGKKAPRKRSTSTTATSNAKRQRKQ